MISFFKKKPASQNKPFELCGRKMQVVESASRAIKVAKILDIQSLNDFSNVQTQKVYLDKILSLYEQGRAIEIYQACLEGDFTGLSSDAVDQEPLWKLEGVLEHFFALYSLGLISMRMNFLSSRELPMNMLQK
ncbi:MAG: hypothetical protein SFU91_00655 [Chloroherpetonaceae bacterium]|nr:hypothetical protein [Chloroherpetonaceae bacterium]